MEGLAGVQTKPFVAYINTVREVLNSHLNGFLTDNVGLQIKQRFAIQGLYNKQR